MRNKALAVGVIALVFVLGLVVANPVAAQQGITDFWTAVVIHSTFEVQGASNFTGTTAHTGAVTFAAGQNTTGAGVFSTYVQAADLKATDDADITDDARITGTVTAGDVSATTRVVAGTYVQGADLKGTDDLDITDDFRITGTVTAVDSTWSGNITQSNGDVTVADDLKVAKQSVITVTMNMTITPVGTFQPLAAAGAVSTANIAAGTAGQWLILYNDGAQTITFTDTGTLSLAGNIALTADDILQLISDGTNWVQAAPVVGN